MNTITAPQAVEAQTDNTGLLIYQDENLAYDIAHEIAPHMDRAMELRDQYRVVSEKDPEGVFVHVHDILSRHLEGRRSGLRTLWPKEYISNGVMAEAFKEEIEQELDEVNGICKFLEEDYEEDKFEELTGKDSDLTNAETKEIAGRVRSRFIRLSRDSRQWLIRNYACGRDEVRGIRSTTIRKYMAEPWREDYKLENSKFITLEDFLGEQAIQGPEA